MKGIKISSQMIFCFVIESAFIIIYVLLKIPRFQELLHILPFHKENPDMLRLLSSSVSAQFTHLDILHLLGNSFFLGYLMKETKEFLKIRHIILISVTGIIFCAVCLLIFADQTKMYIGASGWLGSLLAVCLVNKLKNNHFKVNKSNVDIACLSLTFLVLPLVAPTVSLLMHLSGFLVGAVCSVFLLRNKSDNRRDNYVKNTRC